MIEIEFNGDRIIKFRCGLYRKCWKLEEMEVSSKLQGYFDANSFVAFPINNENSHPNVHLVRILDFLAQHKLDRGPVTEFLSKGSYEAIIVVRKRKPRPRPSRATD